MILPGRTLTDRNLASRNLIGFIQAGRTLTGRTPGIRILTRVRTHTADLSRAVKRKAVCTKR